MVQQRERNYIDFKCIYVRHTRSRIDTQDDILSKSYDKTVNEQVLIRTKKKGVYDR